ncbi:MAG: hypothetical protein HYS08_03905 [Chlamydiae bacterium]|nr:hypothetical protein [Chlamydiota bacterium]
MKKKAGALFIFCVFGIPFLSPAETLDIKHQTRANLPSLTTLHGEEQKNHFSAFAFYETGNVKIGSHHGTWSEITGSVGSRYKNINTYFSYSRFERLHLVDHAVNVGSYFNLSDFYIHEEIGFGIAPTYLYQFQNIAELSHPLYRGLYGELRHTYRDYAENDSQLFSPGLTYYFGNHFLSASYGISHIASRGNANLVTLKGDFEITDWLRWNAGAAYGQWLYDIQGKDASDEKSYIAYTNFKLKIYKDFHIGIGYSYGTEKPKFIIRSISLFASVKF